MLIFLVAGASRRGSTPGRAASQQHHLILLSTGRCLVNTDKPCVQKVSTGGKHMSPGVKLPATRDIPIP